MPADDDLWAQRVAEKQASRDADDAAIHSGRKSVEQVAAESEAFARALAEMVGEIPLEVMLNDDLDPHAPLDF